MGWAETHVPKCEGPFGELRAGYGAPRFVYPDLFYLDFVERLSSGFDEGEQVGVDLIGVDDGHAVGIAGVGFEFGVL